MKFFEWVKGTNPFSSQAKAGFDPMFFMSGVICNAESFAEIY